MRETPLAASTFAEYCSLGPDRSLAKLAHKLGKPSGYTRQLETWSSEFGWQELVKAYDAERIAERRRKQEAEIEAMNQRHAQIGITQQARALEQIKALMEAKSFGSMAAVQLLKLATDIERLARGAPTDRQELTGKDGEALRQHVMIYLPNNGRDGEQGGDDA